MLNLNLLDRHCERVISMAADHGVGILVGGTLKRGYLSGKYRCRHDLPMDDDYWRWNCDKNPGKVDSIFHKLNGLFEDEIELPRRALHYVLSRRGVSSAIVGHRSIEEVNRNCQIADDLTILPANGPVGSVAPDLSQTLNWNAAI